MICPAFPYRVPVTTTFSYSTRQSTPLPPASKPAGTPLLNTVAREFNSVFYTGGAYNGGLNPNYVCVIEAAIVSAQQMAKERNRRRAAIGLGAIPGDPLNTAEYQNPERAAYWYQRDFDLSFRQFMNDDANEREGRAYDLMRSEDGISPYSPSRIAEERLKETYASVALQERQAIGLLAQTTPTADVIQISSQLSVTDPIGRMLVGGLATQILGGTQPNVSPAYSTLTTSSSAGAPMVQPAQGPPPNVSPATATVQYSSPSVVTPSRPGAPAINGAASLATSSLAGTSPPAVANAATNAGSGGAVIAMAAAAALALFFFMRRK